MTDLRQESLGGKNIKNIKNKSLHYGKALEGLDNILIINGKTRRAGSPYLRRLAL